MASPSPSSPQRHCPLGHNGSSTTPCMPCSASPSVGTCPGRQPMRRPSRRPCLLTGFATHLIARFWPSLAPRRTEHEDRWNLCRAGNRQPLICVGDPRKGLMGWFVCFVPPPCSGSADRGRGRRWSARSAARTNDLDARRRGAACWTGGVDEAQRRCDSTHVGNLASVGQGFAASSEGGACRRPALSGSTDEVSGDMMTDGVPGVRVSR
jgi:hypothetical protein